MTGIAKYIVRFILLIFVQVFVLDMIHLHQMVTPYVYFLFIIWLPFKMPRMALMLVAFFVGLAMDSFRHHPGFHAAACVLIAYVKPFLANLLSPQQGKDFTYEEPSVKSFGTFTAYFTFITMLSLLHNAWLFLLEAWQFGNTWYFIVKTVLSTAISILLILITELIFTRKQKFKTNTV